ncbi:MAG: hypothetical protein UEE41_04765 [Acutalibacteraceae bacterium]|nr:hypothetical protein [Acutalibacteraceae bacterium]
MILYLKQSTEPGNLLFHVMDEWGHPCYQVLIDKHRFGKYIYIETTEREKVADIHCMGFSKILRSSILINGRKRMTLLCSFVASEPLFKINGQTWVFRGDVLLRNFDVVDVDRTVIFIHGTQWMSQSGNGYILQIEQPEFALESLCLSVIIDAFSSDGECTQTTAELN